MPASDYLANKVLDKVLRGVDFTISAAFVSLHRGDPGITGILELPHGAGGGSGIYDRQQVSTAGWSPAVSRVSDNVNPIQWVNMASAAVRYIGVWDAVSNGNFLASGPLSPATTSVPTGDTFQVNSSRLTVTLL